MQCRGLNRPGPSWTWLRSHSYAVHRVIAAEFARTERCRQKKLVEALPRASSEEDVFFAGKGKDGGTERAGPHAPKLPRKPASGKSGAPNSGGGGSSGGGGGGQVTERSLAAILVYSGLVGTTAIVLSNLAGIDLWGAFDWAEVEDLEVALVCSIPLQLLNIGLLLPSYTSWRLPDLSRPEEDLQVKRAAAAAAVAARPSSDTSSGVPMPPASDTRPAEAPDSAGTLGVIGADATPSISRSEGKKASSAAGSPLSDGSEQGTHVGTERGGKTQPALHSDARVAPAAAGTASRVSDPQAPEGFLPAAAWGAGGSKDAKGGEGKSILGADWTDLRSALHLAQGYYVNNNPTAKLSAAAEAAVAAVDTAAAEMLFRGVALTWLASWLEDRISEAGLHEQLAEQLPLAVGVVGGPALQEAASSLGVYGACECAVAVSVTLFVAWSVLARSQRAVKQLETVLSAVTTRSGAASSGKASSSKAGAGTHDGKPTRPAQQQQQMLVATGGTSMAGVSAAGAVMTRAAMIQATRDAAQVLLLNAVFIATDGNLAASYSAALLNQLIFSALQRHGVRRLRERSAVMARELKAYNEQVLKIAAKYKSKLPEEAAKKLDAVAQNGSEEADEGAGPASGLLPTQAVQSTTTAARASTTTTTTTTTSSSHTTHPDLEVPSGHHSAGTDPPSVSSGTASGSEIPTASIAVSAAAAAAAAVAQGGDAPFPSASSTLHTSTSSSNSSGSGVAGDRRSAHRSGLESALAALDQLVPEPPKVPAGRPQARAPVSSAAGSSSGGAGASSLELRQ